MPATVKDAMKYGPPRSPKWSEQIVSATHKAAPSRYNLHSAVTSTEATFTGLQCWFDGPSEKLSENVPSQAPIL